MATQQESYGQVANYNISPGTRADQQSSALEVDSKGNLLVNLNAGNPAVTLGQVEITDGTNTANILKSDGTAVGQNAQIVAGGGMTTATLTLNAGSPNTAWFDMLNYAWVSVEILTNGSGATMTFQTSGDSGQTNPRSMGFAESISVTNQMTTTSTSAVGSYHAPRVGRYFRISSNVSGGNSITLVLTFYTTPSALNSFGVSAAQFTSPWIINTGSATGSGVPANAFYMGVNGSSGKLEGLHNNYDTTTGDTPTITTATTTNGATQTNYNARGAIITVILGTVSGVSPSLSIQLQWSPDGGTTWLTYGPASTTLASVTGQTLAIICYPTVLPNNLLGTTTTGDDAEINAPLPRTWRVTYISTGTITSIAVSSVQVNYML